MSILYYTLLIVWKIVFNRMTNWSLVKNVYPVLKPTEQGEKGHRPGDYICEANHEHVLFREKHNDV